MAGEMRWRHNKDVQVIARIHAYVSDGYPPRWIYLGWALSSDEEYVEIIGLDGELSIREDIAGYPILYFDRNEGQYTGVSGPMMDKPPNEIASNLIWRTWGIGWELEGYGHGKWRSA